ncbi:MAG TPA: hypothetical protein VLX28_23725, partial [Thermoanaerobaculia bacterium]|nr:hypothetical protein [Thermoanaerobaculia bacterium]
IPLQPRPSPHPQFGLSCLLLLKVLTRGYRKAGFVPLFQRKVMYNGMGVSPRKRNPKNPKAPKGRQQNAPLAQQIFLVKRDAVPLKQLYQFIPK